MNARIAVRSLSLLALAATAGCGDVQSTGILAPSSQPRLSTVAATTNRTYTSFGAGIAYDVNGPFHDVIAFTVPRAGVYQVTVLGNTQIVGCSVRYCMSPGTLKATVSGAQVTSAAGAAIASVAVRTPVSLAAGSYLLVVDGAGVGTGRYVNSGNYTVTIWPPVVPPRRD